MGDIHGVRVTPGGVVLDSIVICDDFHDQLEPSISFGNGIYLVCWTDRRYELPGVYCARILPDGSVIENNGFPIHPDSMDQNRPAVAFDGNNFLVVWVAFDTTGFGIYGARVSTDGNVLDSVPITISQGDNWKTNPDISFDGSNYMVIWDDARPADEEYDEWAARVTTDGVLIDTNGIPVDTSDGDQNYPSISFLDPYYLAVWTDRNSGLLNIFGKRISTYGDLIDASAISLCTASGPQLNAITLSGSERYLVAWTDGRTGYENADIYAEFVDTAGTGVEEFYPLPFPEGVSIIASPNPFSTKTEISFSIGHRAERIELKIFDLAGRCIKKFPVPTSQFPNCVSWDGLDKNGNPVPPGLYFCVMGNGKMSITVKLMLIK